MSDGDELQIAQMALAADRVGHEYPPSRDHMRACAPCAARVVVYQTGLAIPVLNPIERIADQLGRAAHV